MKIETFIKRAHRIVDRCEKSLITLEKAKDEIRGLLMEFEEWVKSVRVEEE